MGGYDFKNKKFGLHETFFQDNLLKRLHYSNKSYYPIGALLRIDKYKKKGFDISKREMIKLSLHCTNHKIESIEQLEEEVGTMYGVNLKEHMPKTEKDFTFENMIEDLENLPEDVDFNIKPKYHYGVDSDDNNWRKAFPNAIRAIKIKENYYEADINDYIFKEINKDKVDKEKYPIKEVEYPLYVYKWVLKDTVGKLRSIYKHSFVYEVGKEVIDKTGHGIYTGFKQQTFDNVYSNSYDKDRVMIEICVKKEKDITRIVESPSVCTILIHKGTVTRILTDEEIKGEPYVI
jgi:hypothetical protein